MDQETDMLRKTLVASLSLNGQLGEALEECILLLSGRLEANDEMVRRHIQALGAYRQMRTTLSSPTDN